MYIVRSLKITLDKWGKSESGEMILREAEFETLAEALECFDRRKEFLSGFYYRIVIIYNQKIIKEEQNY